MAVLRNPESEETKERARHEQFHSEWTIGGLQPGNPYVYRQYPMMLFQARQVPGNGRWAVALEPPSRHGFRDHMDWDMACSHAASFTASCQRTVNNEAEHKRAREEGWRDSQGEALEFRAALDKMIGDEAAARNYRDRNMSEKAKAESDAIQAETFGHVPSIPEQPIKRRPGRPAKAKGTAA